MTAMYEKNKWVSDAFPYYTQQLGTKYYRVICILQDEQKYLTYEIKVKTKLRIQRFIPFPPIHYWGPRRADWLYTGLSGTIYERSLLCNYKTAYTLDESVYGTTTSNRIKDKHIYPFSGVFRTRYQSLTTNHNVSINGGAPSGPWSLYIGNTLYTITMPDICGPY
jgi:hypothetical protein